MEYMTTVDHSTKAAAVVEAIMKVAKGCDVAVRMRTPNKIYIFVSYDRLEGTIQNHQIVVGHLARVEAQHHLVFSPWNARTQEFYEFLSTLEAQL